MDKVQAIAGKISPGERKFVNCAGCNMELPSNLIATRVHINARHAPLCGTCADVPRDKLVAAIREEMQRLRDRHHRHKAIAA